MAVSAQSSSLRNLPGYAPRPSAPMTAVSGGFPALPSLPQVPAIDDARAPNAATRSWLLNQLGPMAQMNNAALTNIQAGAKMNLAGYGGYSFGKDDPGTPEREDLKLAFDPKAGPGEKEKGAYHGEVNQANAHGLLYSSMANQNIAAAMQRLSLEAQQIAIGYATSINQQQTAYATQVSNTIGQWTSLYGQDAAWLAENPPPPPAPAPAGGATAPVMVKAYGGSPGGEALPAGYGVVWTGTSQPSSATMNTRYGNNWFVVPLSNGKYAVAARTS